MASKKEEPKLAYVSLDSKNAILFNRPNSEYVEEVIERLTNQPGSKAKIHAEVAKRFALDGKKVNALLVRYVNLLNQKRRREDTSGKELSDILMKKDLQKLCRVLKEHRYVEIRLSNLRGYRECLRCGKVETKYKLKGG